MFHLYRKHSGSLTFIYFMLPSPNGSTGLGSVYTTVKDFSVKRVCMSNVYISIDFVCKFVLKEPSAENREHFVSTKKDSFM